MTQDERTEARRRAIRRIIGAIGATPVAFAVASEGQTTKATKAATLTSSGSMIEQPFDKRSRVRVGLIGTGVRGVELLANILPIKSVDVVALCDVFPERTQRAAKIVTDRGRPPPQLFAGSETVWERLCERTEPDLVVIATPWQWHVPMAIASMRAGAHVAVEVPASTTIEGCWELVQESERTRRHCVLLENVCYGQEELLVLNMVRAAVFGTVVHCEGAYIHDLRAQLSEIPPNGSRGAWRRAAHRNRAGDLYPTHGLGPLATYLRINRGDVLQSLVSVSSREAGLSSFIARNAARDSGIRRERFRCGDVTTSMLRTGQGVSVMLQHCVVGPRPYTRHNLVQGTIGAFAGFPPRIYLDDSRLTDHPEWKELGELRKKYEHPLWAKNGETARALGGHGGMDYLMLYRLIGAMTEGRPPDIDVYDAATWSSVSPLSELSIERGGASIAFPDFTGGAWAKKRQPFIA